MEIYSVMVYSKDIKRKTPFINIQPLSCYVLYSRHNNLPTIKGDSQYIATKENKGVEFLWERKDTSVRL